MQIIPIASGKGGVGKSLISANLAIALGKAGKKVILADLDLGASNLHLVIGQQAPKAGLGTFLTGQSKFEDIILQTEYENVSFIPGDSEIPGLSLLKSEQKSQIIKKFQHYTTFDCFCQVLFKDICFLFLIKLSIARVLPFCVYVFKWITVLPELVSKVVNSCHVPSHILLFEHHFDIKKCL